MEHIETGIESLVICRPLARNTGHGQARNRGREWSIWRSEVGVRPEYPAVKMAVNMGVKDLTLMSISEQEEDLAGRKRR